MVNVFRQCAIRVVSLVARVIGSRIRDEESGEVLGKAIILPWRGKIYVIGYSGIKPLTMAFQTRARVSYWKQEVGFGSHNEPDFPRMTKPSSIDE